MKTVNPISQGPLSQSQPNLERTGEDYGSQLPKLQQPIDKRKSLIEKYKPEINKNNVFYSGVRRADSGHLSDRSRVSDAFANLLG